MSHLTVDPSEIIYAVTMQDILSAIERRLGEEVSTLTEEDILLACTEVQISFNHNFNEKDFIEEGLDAWEIIRNLT